MSSSSLLHGDEMQEILMRTQTIFKKNAHRACLDFGVGTCVCVLRPPAAPNLIAVPFFFTVIIIFLNISDPGAREEGHRLRLV